MGWGGSVFTFLQLAHAGDAHARNATVHMGWGGVGLCSRSFNLHTLVMHTPGMLRYTWGWGGVGLCSRSFNLHTLVMHTPGMLRYTWGWGGGVMFTFLQLAHAGDAQPRQVMQTDPTRKV